MDVHYMLCTSSHSLFLVLYVFTSCSSLFCWPCVPARSAVVRMAGFDYKPWNWMSLANTPLMFGLSNVDVVCIWIHFLLSREFSNGLAHLWREHFETDLYFKFGGFWFCGVCFPFCVQECVASFVLPPFCSPTPHNSLQRSVPPLFTTFFPNA